MAVCGAPSAKQSPISREIPGSPFSSHLSPSPAPFLLHPHWKRSPIGLRWLPAILLLHDRPILTLLPVDLTPGHLRRGMAEFTFLALFKSLIYLRTCTTSRTTNLTHNAPSPAAIHFASPAIRAIRTSHSMEMACSHTKFQNKKKC